MIDKSASKKKTDAERKKNLMARRSPTIIVKNEEQVKAQRRP
jgi:hypothetical protein